MKRLLLEKFSTRLAILGLGMLFTWTAMAEVPNSRFSNAGEAASGIQWFVDGMSLSESMGGRLLFSSLDGRRDKSSEALLSGQVGLATIWPLRFDTGYVSRISSLTALALVNRGGQTGLTLNAVSHSEMSSVAELGDDSSLQNYQRRHTQGWEAAMTGRSLADLDADPPLFLAEESDYLHFQLVRYFRWSK